MTQQPHIQGLEELYDNWFYSLAGEEPDGTYTLTVHEVHDGEAYSKLEELITAYTNKQIEALLDRLDKSMPTAEQLATKYGYHMPEKQYGYKIGLHDIREVIEAERKRLKEAK